MTDIKLSAIVAMAENRCIGIDNVMPWHISEDLKRFKALTLGHPVIMGRKTFESVLGYLKKPFPGRTSIVISRAGYETEFDVPITSTLEDAVTQGKNIAREAGLNEVFIAGGAQIYALSLPLVDRIHLTKIHQSVEGDAFFPPIDMDEWQETTRNDRQDHDPPFSFITLDRV